MASFQVPGFRKKGWRFFRPAGAVFLVLIALVSVAEAGTTLVSHRAFYTFKLGYADTNSDITSVDGAMRMAMERTCDGWVLGQDVNMVLGTAEGQGITNRVRFAALESFDGLTYDFVVRSRTGDVAEAIRGRASLPGREKDGEIVFKAPPAEPMPLPRDTLFPLAHLKYLIEQAEAGKTHVAARTFDGTEVEPAQRAIAFIGAPRLPDAEMVERLGPLVAGQRGWTMRIAYFRDEAADGTPEVEVELYQLENGITPRLVLDYGFFTAEVEAQALEEVPVPDCS